MCSFERPHQSTRNARRLLPIIPASTPIGCTWLSSFQIKQPSCQRQREDFSAWQRINRLVAELEEVHRADDETGQENPKPGSSHHSSSNPYNLTTGLGNQQGTSGGPSDDTSVRSTDVWRRSQSFNFLIHHKLLYALLCFLNYCRTACSGYSPLEKNQWVASQKCWGISISLPFPSTNGIHWQNPNTTIALTEDRDWMTVIEEVTGPASLRHSFLMLLCHDNRTTLCCPLQKCFIPGYLLNTRYAKSKVRFRYYLGVVTEVDIPGHIGTIVIQVKGMRSSFYHH